MIDFQMNHGSCHMKAIETAMNACEPITREICRIEMIHRKPYLVLSESGDELAEYSSTFDPDIGALREGLIQCRNYIFEFIYRHEMEKNGFYYDQNTPRNS